MEGLFNYIEDLEKEILDLVELNPDQAMEISYFRFHFGDYLSPDTIFSHLKNLIDKGKIQAIDEGISGGSPRFFKFSTPEKYLYLNGKDLPVLKAKKHRTSIVFYKNGVPHRSGDKPAVIYDDGYKSWWKDGKKHREWDLPAIIRPNGDMFWYHHGLVHRGNNNPAIIYGNGKKEWIFNGKRIEKTDTIKSAPPFSLKNSKQKLNMKTDKLINFKEPFYKNGKKIFCKKDFAGNIYYFNELNQLHNENDEPAIIRWNGERDWLYEGKYCREDNKPTIENDYAKYWTDDKGKNHRENDLPAIVCSNGDQEWYCHGLNHRDNDLPAVLIGNEKSWYQHGLIHRDGDQPAMIGSDYQKFYKNGELHRDNDLPAIERPGQKEYWVNGLRHRDNGLPAIEFTDPEYRAWYIKNELHRLDGPAIIYGRQSEYWVAGKLLSKIEFESYTKNIQFKKEIKSTEINETDEAIYRVAARKINKSIIFLIEKFINSRELEKDKKEFLLSMIGNEYGKSILSYVIGSSLNYIPEIKNNKHVEKIGGEIRADSFGLLTENFMSEIVDFIKSSQEIPVIVEEINCISSEKLHLNEKSA